MAVMSMQSSKVNFFIKHLRTDFPQFNFKAGKQDFWSPSAKTITYNPNRTLVELKHGLLHELSHALLQHRNYSSDFRLLKMESEAWYKAAELGKKYGLRISDEHIQNCLDTYRDWLHQRSRCPDCGLHVLQSSPTAYKCFNCGAQWSVTSSRFRRTYRKKNDKLAS